MRLSVMPRHWIRQGASEIVRRLVQIKPGSTTLLEILLSRFHSHGHNVLPQHSRLTDKNLAGLPRTGWRAIELLDINRNINYKKNYKLVKDC
jgi:hypothetical protein